MAPAKSPKTPEPTADPVLDQLSSYLKDTKDEHYNFEDNIDYHVSSGSLNVDMEIQGFGPGVHRLGGPSQSGKSAFALEVARNFLSSVPNSRVLYIKAEGRLSEENKARSGLAYVERADDWIMGTVFVHKTSIYENAIGLMRTLVRDNPTKCRYMFIIDSMDGLNLRNDYNKAIDEGVKVAGAPLLTKQFLQKVSLAMTQYGHMCFFLSQVSADIKIDPYSKSTPRQMGGGGGNAVAHFANEVLEFQQPYESGLILTDSTVKHDGRKNPALGHTCKVRIQKSDKERRFRMIEIPIRYGQTNGQSIWREREIADQLLTASGFIVRSGSWFKLSDLFREQLKEAGFTEVPDQIQGLDRLCEYLEKHEDLTDHLFSYFRGLIGAPVVT